VETRDLLRYARGDEPADILLSNARVVNVLSGEIVDTDVAVVRSHIVGLGEYEARETIDLEGSFLAPGLIDAHVHIESSLVPPSEFARTVVPTGTTTVVTDPHEIANVLGLDGIRFMFEDAKRQPISMFVMAPSCVPATPMETNGAVLESYDLAPFKADPWVLGLAEVMNFPGVVSADASVLDKIRAFEDRVIDGHCPALTGKALNAYVAAGIGSDHECTDVEEAREKLRLGLTIFIREATNARNLRTLLPLVNPENQHRICLCTDDRQPADLLDEGHIDFMVRVAIEEGVEPMTALRMATINPANYFRLSDRGAVAPGRRADMLVFDDLTAPRARMVFRGGALVARDGELVARPETGAERFLRGTVNVDWARVDLRIPAEGRHARVIGVVPDQLVTEHLVEEMTIVDGEALSAPERDLLKMVVIERHRSSGSTGKGFVRGMGLKRGALASTIAHDHHNLVTIGVDDESISTAARAVAALGGGMAAADGSQVLAEVPLPIGGLMSDRPIDEVRRQLDAALDVAHDLGSPLHDPFMAMSFLALEVIPALKLTDKGLVDVERFEVVPLFAEQQ
jgi:adenine deaminase